MSTAARPAAVRPRKRASARASKIDWALAFQAFAIDPTLGYAGVARRFGVSEAAVRKHAKAEDWLHRVGEMRARASDKAAERTVGEFQREAKAIGHELLAKIRAAVSDGSETPKPSDFAPIVKILQLLHGEATDRVQVAEVQALSDAFVALIVRIAPPDVRDGVLVELEQLEHTFGALVAIERGAR